MLAVSAIAIASAIVAAAGSSANAAADAVAATSAQPRVVRSHFGPSPTLYRDYRSMPPKLRRLASRTQCRLARKASFDRAASLREPSLSVRFDDLREEQASK